MRKPRQPLTQTHPELVRQWLYAVDTDVSPDQAGKGSKYRVRWQCPVDPDHQWEAIVSSRASGRGCPYCAGQRVLPADSFARQHPELASELDEARNLAAGLPPGIELAPKSSRKVHWRCRHHSEHVWTERVHERLARKDPSCPVCLSVGHRHPELMEEWDEQANHAIGLDPSRLRPGSDRVAHWICRHNPSHRWLSPIKKRALAGHGCHYCTRQKATPENCVANDPETSAYIGEWHPTLNGTRTPFNVTRMSGYLAYWQCSEHPEHLPWRAAVYNRRLQGTGHCPECRSLSHLMPKLAKEWDPTRNGAMDPRTVSLGSSYRAWWICARNPTHRWQAGVADRSGGTRAGTTGNGCPYCSLHHRSKMELAIGFELQALCMGLLKVEVEPQRIRTSDDRRPIQVDLLLPELKLVLEYDGHYWHEGKESQDREKNRRLASTGHRVARIRDDLTPIGPLDAVVDRGSDVVTCVVAFATKSLLSRRLRSELDRLKPDLADRLTERLTRYAEDGRRIARKEADAFFEASLPDEE